MKRDKTTRRNLRKVEERSSQVLDPAVAGQEISKEDVSSPNRPPVDPSMGASQSEGSVDPPAESWTIDQQQQSEGSVDPPAESWTIDQQQQSEPASRKLDD